MSYKWSNPQAWLEDWMKGASNDQLEWAITQLASLVDHDEIQDSFQELMDEEGYFEEGGGLMTSYHFSMGNSSVGPIGLCARVTAHSEMASLALLRQRLNEITGDDFEVSLRGGPEYIAVYIQPNNMTIEMIDEVGG